ncbi:hypothetical protein DFP73DRAFT_582837 [Morchella snyderi]|nr:hypothetical protein DFP73DRAFT_582837 [Morchella snyderi]
MPLPIPLPLPLLPPLLSLPKMHTTRRRRRRRRPSGSLAYPPLEHSPGTTTTRAAARCTASSTCTCTVLGWCADACERALALCVYTLLQRAYKLPTYLVGQTQRI